MGAVRGQAATLQVEMVCLDELVAEDDRYRKLDRLVDWSFVREVAEPYYAEEVGRPSIDPIVLVKLMVAGALEGVGSTRELLRQASVRLDLRRFLGYGLGERLPVHQTLSHAHTRRFVDATLFERLFVRSLELCKQHGLVEGTHLSIDGFHAEADAALASLRASLALAPPEAGTGDDLDSGEGSAPEPAGQLALEDERAGGRPGGERPALTLAEPRSGPTPKRRSSNRTSVSVTDPEAKLRGKPGQRPHLVYRGQVAVDRKRRVIVACLGEQADGFEGDAVGAAPGPGALRLARAGIGRSRFRLCRRTRLAGGGAARAHRLHPATTDDAAERRPGRDDRGAAPSAGGAGALQERGRDRRASTTDG